MKMLHMFVAAVLVFALSAPILAQDAAISAVLEAPEVFVANNADENTIPFVARVTTADGKAYSGKVLVHALYGTLVTADGEVYYGQWVTEAVDGKIEASVRLGIISGMTHPVTIMIMDKDSHKVFGQTQVNVLCPTSHEWLETSKMHALADGKDRPVIRIRIKDQFGQPLKGAKAILPAPWRERGDEDYSALTDADGVAVLMAPTRTYKCHIPLQVLSGAMATDQQWAFWHDSELRMVSFREAANRSGVEVGWDKETRTASARWTFDRVSVRVGDRYALMNGRRVLLVSPARINEDGKLELPASFFSQIFGMGIYSY